MEVFTKLNAVEDEIFVEIDRISKEMVVLKGKLTKLRELAKVMNPDRVKNSKGQVIKK